MTELERARGWLKDCQDRLAYERSFHDKVRVRFFESAVLAALSWVWEAQERERLQIRDTTAKIYYSVAVDPPFASGFAK